MDDNHPFRCGNMISSGKNAYGIHKVTCEIVHIESAANGLRCNCVCPACRADLVARNGGTKRAPHFAHYSGMTCEWAGETDAHLMAKEIIKEKNFLYAPEQNGQHLANGSNIIEFTNVECEVWVDSKKPDCVCKHITKDGKELTIWVEIRVAHKIDDEKLDHIKKNRIPCIEIDLHQYNGLHEKTGEFVNAVLGDADRIWINPPYLGEIDRATKSERNQGAIQLTLF